MFITRAMKKDEIHLTHPCATDVGIDLTKLIEGIVISPFADISLRQSVLAVTKLYGIDKNLVSISSLLDDCEYLLDAYSDASIVQ